MIWTGSTVSQLGTSIGGVAAPLVAVRVLDASVLAVSLLTAVAWLPWLLIGLPAGAWIDRVAKRPVMLASDAISGAAAITVPIAAWAGCLTVGHLLAVAALLGTSAVFFQLSWTGYLPAMFHERQLVDANAALQGSQSATQAVGPALAGALATATSALSGFLVNAVSFACSWVCLVRIGRPERPVPDRRRAGTLREIQRGAAWVARDPYLRLIAAHGALGNAALTGVQAILVVFLVRDVDAGAATVGLLLALMSLGGVAGAAVAPGLARRFGTARTMLVTKVAAGPFALLIPLTRGGGWLMMFVVGSATLVMGIVAGNVISGTFRQTYCPRGALARVAATTQFVNLGTAPLGAVLAGALATAAGTRTALWIMCACVAASGLVLIPGPFRGRRDLPRHASGASL